jgi:hypothetical protein
VSAELLVATWLIKVLSDSSTKELLEEATLMDTSRRSLFVLLFFQRRNCTAKSLESNASSEV